MNFPEFLKTTANVLHIAAGNDRSKKFTSALILTGGSSVRTGGSVTKQMTFLCGKPVVAHTLIAFQECEAINEIIVVAKEDEAHLYKGLAEKYGLNKITAVVNGGETRRKSALNGFGSISPKADFVAIHDAARCLITKEDIEKVLFAAMKYKAATAACKATDTVKIADKKGFIERTEDRNLVWLAATPQIFARNLYCAAAYTADEENFEATDDNMLVERIGYRVKLVETSRDNIKITHADDFEKAEMILRKRGV